MKREIAEPRSVSDGAGRQLIPASTPAALDSGVHPFTGGNNYKRRIDPVSFHANRRSTARYYDCCFQNRSSDVAVYLSTPSSALYFLLRSFYLYNAIYGQK